jgi:hypothetical protein
LKTKKSKHSSSETVSSNESHESHTSQHTSPRKSVADAIDGKFLNESLKRMSADTSSSESSRRSSVVSNLFLANPDRRKIGPRGRMVFRHRRWRSLDWTFSYTDQELWKQQSGFYEVENKLQRWQEHGEETYENILLPANSLEDGKPPADSSSALVKKYNQAMKELADTKKELNDSLQREQVLETELKKKEEDITELNKRCMLINEEATKARDHAKRLEKEISFVCSYQSVFLKDKKTATKKYLEKEREFNLLKIRHRDCMAVFQQKIQVFSTIIQDYEQKNIQMENMQKQLHEANKLIEALSKEINNSQKKSEPVTNTL